MKLFALVLFLCAVPSYAADSCEKPRHFKQFDWAPVHDKKSVSPSTLPSNVQRAVNHYMVAQKFDRSRFRTAEEAFRTWRDPADRRYYPIVLARDEGRCLLLEIENRSAFDANWFVVYSKSLDCIVGTFVWRVQG